MVDHDLMKSLEYKGEYGRQYRCSDCKHFKDGKCSMINYDGIKVSGTNNICRKFEARIKNPSSPEFNFDDYLEFLMSDYYRPWSVDTSIIVGSAKLGEVKIDGGRLAKLLPKTYSPYYKPYDKPYCRIVRPLTVVTFGKYSFEIDYRLYRINEWISDTKIKYTKCYWKDKQSAKKYNVLYNSEFIFSKIKRNK